MSKPKVLVSDPISQLGVDALAEGGQLDVTFRPGLPHDELLAIIPEYSALVVRSQTKVGADVIAAASKLKAVGRAGVGVDNVDVDAATRRGIVVMNTPGGNTVSTAEHAFSLLVSVARKIPQADASVKSGKWDRKSFQGVELNGKTLAVLGMGRIGTEVAKRARAFGMHVLAYDPYLSEARAQSLQVELVEDLDEALPRADFVTMHMPLTDETRHMLDARRLALLKKGARVVNCARGGLIDEKALAESLASGHLAGAAVDVFEEEPPGPENPLRTAPNVVFTPHLGASTAEAQESVGIEIAHTIRAAILDGTINNAVNAPSVDAKTLAVLGPYLRLGESLGRFVAQIAPKRCGTLRIVYSGKARDLDTAPVTRSILKGFLAHISGDEVNEINAPGLAANLGLQVVESRVSDSSEFTDLISVIAEDSGAGASVGGTFFGQKPRVVVINGKHVEAQPEGVLLLLENRDRPGIVGHIGTLLAKHNINIAGMSLGRDQAGGTALTVLNLDSAPADNVMAELRGDPDIYGARVLRL
ncbi:MAG: phosphoglycerate dehydrogenase [Chthoniobacterales bacterium]|nr:phosphoglycerate dehydrogenase [Chthoniobacterales bacterium]